MTDSNMIKREPHWKVRLLGRGVKPKKYIGTWGWDAGYIAGLNFMPLFHITKSSHGYRKGGKWTSLKGPIIKTRIEALRQAKAAMLEIK